MKGERTRLATELEQSEQELAELTKRLGERPEFGPGQGSPRAYTWQMTLARKEKVQEHIEDLRAALRRVEEGEYGLCDRCGKGIDPERLAIVSTARLCMACARAAN